MAVTRLISLPDTEQLLAHLRELIRVRDTGGVALERTPEGAIVAANTTRTCGACGHVTDDLGDDARVDARARAVAQYLLGLEVWSEA